MKKVLIINYLIILFAFLAACEKDIDIPFPDQERKLVIYGLLDPDEIISVDISHTIPTLEKHPDDFSIKNATVSLFIDSAFVEKLKHQGDGKYISQSNLKPKARRAYHFVVTAPNYDSITTAPVILPKRIRDPIFTFEDSSLNSTNRNESYGILTWEIPNQKGIEEFFGIKINEFRPGGELDRHYNSLIGYSEEYEEYCGYFSQREINIFADYCLDENGSNEVKIGVRTSYFNRDINEFSPLHHLEVHFLKIPPDYYRYLKSIYQPEGLDLIFSSPQSLYSNVNGGYGFIGTYTSLVVKVNI